MTESSKEGYGPKGADLSIMMMADRMMLSCGKRCDIFSNFCCSNSDGWMVSSDFCTLIIEARSKHEKYN
jgi:hypothetical protein